VTLSFTVMEEVDAERLLAELVRSETKRANRRRRAVRNTPPPDGAQFALSRVGLIFSTVRKKEPSMQSRFA
jgi:hypothetical protein